MKKCHFTLILFIGENGYRYMIMFKIPDFSNMKDRILSFLDWSDRQILRLFGRKSKDNGFLEGEMAKLLGKALEAEQESFWKKKYWQESKCSIR